MSLILFVYIIYAVYILLRNDRHTNQSTSDRGQPHRRPYDTENGGRKKLGKF